ncbi:MAG TPA: hypothetical protein VHT03_07380 [Rhizomicrobium sp.]|jgi:hypothetical protein|nr:hypothetical protein [Rhizomicrobium sp.]
MTAIYMPLDNEGTDVWKSVEAESLGGGRFCIRGPMPEGEVWRFAPGSVVRSRPRKFADGTEGIEAVEISN